MKYDSVLKLLSSPSRGFSNHVRRKHHCWLARPACCAVFLIRWIGLPRSSGLWPVLEYEISLLLLLILAINSRIQTRTNSSSPLQLSNSRPFAHLENSCFAGLFPPPLTFLHTSLIVDIQKRYEQNDGWRLLVSRDLHLSPLFGGFSGMKTIFPISPKSHISTHPLTHLLSFSDSQGGGKN